MTDHTSHQIWNFFFQKKLTEKNILDFPMFDITSAESPIPRTTTSSNSTITPPNPPNTFIFNGSIKKKKTQYSLRQALQKHKKSEEAVRKYSKTRNPRFHYNLNYTLKEDVNQWKIIFWDSRRQEFTIENTVFKNQRLSVPLRAISAFI